MVDEYGLPAFDPEELRRRRAAQEAAPFGTFTPTIQEAVQVAGMEPAMPATPDYTQGLPESMVSELPSAQSSAREPGQLTPKEYGVTQQKGAPELQRDEYGNYQLNNGAWVSPEGNIFDPKVGYWVDTTNQTKYVNGHWVPLKDLDKASINRARQEAGGAGQSFWPANAAAEGARDLTGNDNSRGFRAIPEAGQNANEERWFQEKTEALEDGSRKYTTEDGQEYFYYNGQWNDAPKQVNIHTGISEQQINRDAYNPLRDYFKKNREGQALQLTREAATPGESNLFNTAASKLDAIGVPRDLLFLAPAKITEIDGATGNVAGDYNPDTRQIRLDQANNFRDPLIIVHESLHAFEYLLTPEERQELYQIMQRVPPGITVFAAHHNTSQTGVSGLTAYFDNLISGAPGLVQGEYQGTEEDHTIPRDVLDYINAKFPEVQRRAAQRTIERADQQGVPAQTLAAGTLKDVVRLIEDETRVQRWDADFNQYGAVTIRDDSDVASFTARGWYPTLDGKMMTPPGTVMLGGTVDALGNLTGGHTMDAREAYELLTRPWAEGSPEINSQTVYAAENLGLIWDEAQARFREPKNLAERSTILQHGVSVATYQAESPDRFAQQVLAAYMHPIPGLDLLNDLTSEAAGQVGAAIDTAAGTVGIDTGGAGEKVGRFIGAQAPESPFDFLTLFAAQFIPGIGTLSGKSSPVADRFAADLATKGLRNGAVQDVNLADLFFNRRALTDMLDDFNPGKSRPVDLGRNIPTGTIDTTGLVPRSTLPPISGGADTVESLTYIDALLKNNPGNPELLAERARLQGQLMADLGHSAFGPDSGTLPLDSVSQSADNVGSSLGNRFHGTGDDELRRRITNAEEVIADMDKNLQGMPNAGDDLRSMWETSRAAAQQRIRDAQDELRNRGVMDAPDEKTFAQQLAERRRTENINSTNLDETADAMKSARSRLNKLEQAAQYQIGADNIVRKATEVTDDQIDDGLKRAFKPMGGKLSKAIVVPDTDDPGLFINDLVDQVVKRKTFGGALLFQNVDPQRIKDRIIEMVLAGDLAPRAGGALTKDGRVIWEFNPGGKLGPGAASNSEFIVNKLREMFGSFENVTDDAGLPHHQIQWTQDGVRVTMGRDAFNNPGLTAEQIIEDIAGRAASTPEARTQIFDEMMAAIQSGGARIDVIAGKDVANPQFRIVFDLPKSRGPVGLPEGTPPVPRQVGIPDQGAFNMPPTSPDEIHGQGMFVPTEGRPDYLGAMAANNTPGSSPQMQRLETYGRNLAAAKDDRTRNFWQGQIDREMGATPNALQRRWEAIGSATKTAARENKSLPAKAASLALDILNLPMAVMFGMDYSFLLRQGGLLMPSSLVKLSRDANGKIIRWAGTPVPKLEAGAWPKAAVAGFQALTEERANHIMAQMHNHIYAPLILDEKAGQLHMNPVGVFTGPNMMHEDTFISRLIQYIPGLKQSARANEVFINKLRFDKVVDFIDMRRRQTGQLPTLQEIDTYSRFINAASGYGNTPKAMDDIVPVMNALLTTTRRNIAMWQAPSYMLTGGGERAVQREAIASFASFAGFGFSTLMLADIAGLDVGWDTDDLTNFGKIKVGPQHIDIWGGYQQMARLVYKLANGLSPIGGLDIDDVMTGSPKFQVYLKTPEGYSNVIENIVNPFLDFGRQKLAPNPSVITNALLGQDMNGNPYPQSAGGIALKMLTNYVPLILQDIYEGITDPRGGLFTVPMYGLSFVGVGVQTYTTMDDLRALGMDEVINKGGLPDFITERMKQTDYYNLLPYERKLVDDFVKEKYPDRYEEWVTRRRFRDSEFQRATDEVENIRARYTPIFDAIQQDFINAKTTAEAQAAYENYLVQNRAVSNEINAMYRSERYQDAVSKLETRSEVYELYNLYNGKIIEANTRPNGSVDYDQVEADRADLINFLRQNGYSNEAASILWNHENKPSNDAPFQQFVDGINQMGAQYFDLDDAGKKKFMQDNPEFNAYRWFLGQNALQSAEAAQIALNLSKQFGLQREIKIDGLKTPITDANVQVYVKNDQDKRNWASDIARLEAIDTTAPGQAAARTNARKADPWVDYLYFRFVATPGEDGTIVAQNPGIQQYINQFGGRPDGVGYRLPR